MAKIDTNLEDDFEQQMIVAAWGNLIDERGWTMHEVATLMRNLERDVYPGLLEMQVENKSNQKEN